MLVEPDPENVCERVTLADREVLVESVTVLVPEWDPDVLTVDDLLVEVVCDDVRDVEAWAVCEAVTVVDTDGDLVVDTVLELVWVPDRLVDGDVVVDTVWETV